MGGSMGAEATVTRLPMHVRLSITRHIVKQLNKIFLSYLNHTEGGFRAKKTHIIGLFGNRSRPARYI